MTEAEIKVDEKKEIERILVSSFSKIQNINGQSLDITLVLPILTTIISGTGQTSDKKVYGF